MYALDLCEITVFLIVSTETGSAEIEQPSLSVTVILETTLCWSFNDGDRFELLVTKSLCLRLFRYVGDF